MFPGDPVPIHEVFDDGVESVMRAAGGDGERGHPVAVRLLEIRIRPDLHRRVDEDVGMVLFQNGMKAAVLHSQTITRVISSLS